MRRFLRFFAWFGWVIIGIACLVLWNAPDSAKRAYWWAFQETIDPSTRISVWKFPLPKNFQPPEQYLPSGVFGNESDEFWRKTFSAYLAVFAEPSLYSDPSKPGIRFLYIRAFNDPVMVRISQEPQGWVMISKRSSGSNFDPGLPAHIEFERTIPISQSTADSFQSSLQKIGFWSMETSRGGGLDGAEWLLEARFGDQYRVVKRWSPGYSDPFRKFCVELLRDGNVADGDLY